MSAAATDELVEQGFRFALGPVEAQDEPLSSWLGASRFWFNAGLAEVKSRLDRRASGETEVNLPWSYQGLCGVLDAKWRNQLAPCSSITSLCDREAASDPRAFSNKSQSANETENGPYS